MPKHHTLPQYVRTTHVVMCQPQFVPKILDGTKDRTMRATRKRKIKAGDRLDLRAWRGDPYRSKQKKLRVVTVASVHDVTIKINRRTRRIAVTIDGVDLSFMLLDLLARADGFSGSSELLAFFEDNHGPKFEGQMFVWRT